MFKESIISKIRKIKESEKFELLLHDQTEKDLKLVCVTKNYENEIPNLIYLLTKWRNENQEGFACKFVSTEERTKKWLENLVLNREDRILFLVYYGDNIIGHLGLSSFDFESRTCEIDNVVRGINATAPGIMGKSVLKLSEWAYDYLCQNDVLLRVLEGNNHAVDFYKYLGFHIIEKIPLYRFTDNTGVYWKEKKKSPEDKPEKYFLKMILKNKAKNIPKRLYGVEESMIREMTRFADRENSINLSQGMPDDNPPEELLDELKNCLAIPENNQYSFTFGDLDLRKIISNRYNEDYKSNYDPELEITITCGASEAIMSSCFALFEEGDEVIVFEPYYENYVPSIVFSGAKPVFVSLNPKDWSIDFGKLTKAITKNTKGIMLNNPHNPTGKVFEKESLIKINELARKNGIVIISDEIYEKLIYLDNDFCSFSNIDKYHNNSVVVSGFSKIYNITGWRVGYCLSSKQIMTNIRKVHDYLTVCAPNPFQKALLKTEFLQSQYYKNFINEYKIKRDFFCNELKKIGIKFFLPEAAYYIMADISDLGLGDDLEFAKFLVKEKGVATVPGRAFFDRNIISKNYVRFCFSRKMNVLEEAIKRVKNKL